MKNPKFLKFKFLKNSKKINDYLHLSVVASPILNCFSTRFTMGPIDMVVVAAVAVVVAVVAGGVGGWFLLFFTIIFYFLLFFTLFSEPYIYSVVL